MKTRTEASLWKQILQGTAIAASAAMLQTALPARAEAADQFPKRQVHLYLEVANLENIEDVSKFLGTFHMQCKDDSGLHHVGASFGGYMKASDKWESSSDYWNEGCAGTMSVYGEVRTTAGWIPGSKMETVTNCPMVELQEQSDQDRVFRVRVDRLVFDGVNTTCNLQTYAGP